MDDLLTQIGPPVHVSLVAKVITAIVLTVCLFLSEHHSTVDVMEGSPVEYVVESNRTGNLVRELCYLLIGTIGLVSFLRGSRSTVLFRPRLMISLLALLSWAALSITWAEEPLSSFSRLAVLLLSLAGAWGIVATWPTTQVIEFTAISLTVHLAIGIFAELLLGTFTPWDPAYRFAGTLYWNQQGMLCLFLTLSAATSSFLDKRHRFLFVSLAIFGFCFMALTKSRSSLAGFLIAVGVFSWFTLTRRGKVYLSACVFFAWTFIYLGNASEHMRTAISRSGEGAEDLTGRIPIWQECLTFIVERPLTGYGFEDFWTAKRIDYFSSELHWGISSSHSAYLESVLTLGMVGLTLHCLVLWLGLTEAITLYRLTHGLEFVLAASLFAIYLGIGTLESVLLVKSSPVSFYFSLMLLITAVSREKASPEGVFS